MKTARFILPLLASVMFAGQAGAQQIQPVFIYPNQDQTQEQLNQDRAECEMWTFEQIGFPQGYVAEGDPGKGRTAKTAVIGTVAGAGIGAAAGAIGGKPGKGAAAGAAAGLIGGLIIGSKKKKKAREEAAEEASAADAQYNDNYRRAMTACMTARGYTVN